MSYIVYQSEGIILASWPRGEHDRALWLYTKTYGGVSLVAKGIRLEKSKLRGAVDVFCRAHIGFIAGKEVYRLRHAESLCAHAAVRQLWERYRAAAHIASLVRRAVAGGEPDIRLWLLVRDALLFLDAPVLPAAHIRPFLYSFELRLFAYLGYLPAVLPPAARRLVEEPALFYDHALSSEHMRELALFLQPLRNYAALRTHKDMYIMESIYGIS